MSRFLCSIPTQYNIYVNVFNKSFKKYALSNIPLGRKQEGKVVLSVESNIKKFVADCLANEKNPKTKEPNENYIGHDLPDTETGVWVHYLRQWNTEEIMK